MSDLQMWNLIVGFIASSFVLPIIQQPTWSTQRRAKVTFGFCVVAGVVTAWLSGGFAGAHDLRTAMSSVLMTLVTAVATYKGVSKPLGLAPWLEEATALPPTAPTI